MRLGHTYFQNLYINYEILTNTLPQSTLEKPQIDKMEQSGSRMTQCLLQPRDAGGMPTLQLLNSSIRSEHACPTKLAYCSTVASSLGSFWFFL